MLDFTDLNNPVQYYYDLESYITVNPDYLVRKEVLIQKNSYEIFDDFLGFSNEKKTFYHAVSGDARFDGKITGNTLGNIEVRLSTTGTAYEVTTYSVSDMLAQIGGIYELIRTVMGIFIIYFNHKMYDYSLANSVIKIQRQHQVEKNI